MLRQAASTRGDPEPSLAPSLQRGDDDWLGVDDPSERRKRQNRLHQRAWRRKKASQKALAEHGPLFIYEKFEQSPGQPVESSVEEDNSTTSTFRTQLEIRERISQPVSADTDVLESLHTGSQLALSLGATLANQSQAFGKLIQPVIPYLPSTGTPDAKPTRFNFPLSPDHLLITLIQYNVLRATLTNMWILSLQCHFPLECRAALAVPFEELFSNCEVPTSVPNSLQPTAIQQTVPHDYWIDIIPIPAMRDNLILAAGDYDEDDFCCDMMGGLYEGFDDTEKRGVIVWNDPWSVEGWEVSEGFATKWRFVVKGCDDLIKATNRWRSLRGEEDLVLET